MKGWIIATDLGDSNLRHLRHLWDLYGWLGHGLTRLSQLHDTGPDLPFFARVRKRANDRLVIASTDKTHNPGQRVFKLHRFLIRAIGRHRIESIGDGDNLAHQRYL